jgi:type I restriction-modification system DNA methylase subunit
MQWIAPSEKDAASTSLEKRLWDAADQFRANSGLKAQEYSGPILGLIFLRFAEVRFAIQRNRLEKAVHQRANPGAAAASMSPPPTTPKASSTSPPRRASTTC